MSKKDEVAEKEQRVFKNNGKRFEEDFRASFSNHIWTYRPSDSGGGMMARFTQQSLCDLFAYNTVNKNLVLFELKSTLGTSVSFRPYEQCMEYEEEQRKFDEWNAKQNADTRRPIKEEIAEHRKYLRELSKATNQSMIKYHQIKDLLEIKQSYGIETYLAFTFFRTTSTYVIPIDSFVENFWKKTTKKSINEKDLDELAENKKAYKITQEYIGRSMRSKYEVDFLS